MTSRGQVYAAVTAERARQSAKWAAPHAHGQGDCSSADVPLMVKVAVLAEECGEVARAALDGKHGQLRDELVQVAAVAVAILESLPPGEDETLWGPGVLPCGHGHRAQARPGPLIAASRHLPHLPRPVRLR